MSIQIIDRKKRYLARTEVAGKVVARSFERKIDADLWLGRVRHEGVGSRNERVTFDEAIQKYFGEYSKDQNAASTFFHKQFLYRAYIGPILSRKRLLEIVPADIERLRNTMKAHKLSASTINRAYCLIKHLYNIATKRNWFGIGYDLRNPTLAIDREKEPPKRDSWWSKEETRTFLETVKREDPEYLAHFLVLLHTGARLNEMLALHVGDVDFDKKQIIIRHSFCDKSHEMHHYTKGKKPRAVPLTDELAVELWKKKCALPQDCQLLLCNEVGTHYDTSAFRNRHFYRLLKKAGVPRIRIHDMRHVFASHFLMNGGDLFALKEMLGHQDLKTTMRYAHFSRTYINEQRAFISYESKKALTDGGVIYPDFRKAL